METGIGRLLIVGKGELASELYSELFRSIVDRPRLQSSRVLALGKNGTGIRRYNITDHVHLKELTRNHSITSLVVAEPNFQNQPELLETLLDCKFRGLKVERAVDLYERMYQKIHLDAIAPEWFLFSDGFRLSCPYLRVKRVLDILAALVLLTITAPFMAIIAAAVKLSSPGHLLFRQQRVGRDGQTFTLYKFRSMRADAEEDTGPVWADENDDRVTPTGRVLRKFHLDEIPQAWNVLRGDLSLVGPRPERPFFVEHLKKEIPYYELRHYIKPGISGWAQVNYEYGDSIEDAYEKLRYDLYYLKHVSFGLDIWILLKTIWRVLLGRGR